MRAEAFHSTTCINEGPWPKGDMPRSSRSLPYGRAEPAPPRGGPSRARWPTGGRSEMTRNAVSSEGRTPCVRLAWPNACRGIPFSRDGRAGPVRPRGHASVKPKPSLRACGARPSAGRAIRWPTGGRSEMTRNAVSSEGRTPCVRVARPHASRGISFHHVHQRGPVA
jgi:hypothetical protein